MLPPSPTIDRCKTAILLPLAFLAGAKLDLFTELGDELANAEDLANRLRVDSDWLLPLLKALVAAGLLERDADAFRNSDEADHFLVRGRPHFIGDVHRLYEELWQGAFRAAELVKAGSPLAAHDYGTMNEEAMAAFFRGQHYDALLAGWKLADAFDLRGARHLADIGGGSGGLAIALCERYHDLHGDVLDLSNVVPIANRYIADSTSGDRLQTRACDLLAGPVSGTYDLAVMRSLLQVLAPSECRQLLANVREGLASEARLFILGQITDDDGVHPETAAMFNLIFLSFYEQGRSHSEAEHREWLGAAGYREIERRITQNGLNSMIARA